MKNYIILLFVVLLFVISSCGGSSRYENYDAFEKEINILYSFSVAKECLDKEDIFEKVIIHDRKKEMYDTLQMQSQWDTRQHELMTQAHERIQEIKEMLVIDECYCCRDTSATSTLKSLRNLGK